VAGERERAEEAVALAHVVVEYLDAQLVRAVRLKTV
jgi:hypothetical protein